MATETSLVSPAPWDLATGNKWTVHGDRKIDGDHNNEVIVDAKGNVVAYISGFNDEGGNGSLLAAAPALAEVLFRSWEMMKTACEELSDCGAPEGLINSLNDEIGRAYAALKKAGAL